MQTDTHTMSSGTATWHEDPTVGVTSSAAKNPKKRVAMGIVTGLAVTGGLALAMGVNSLRGDILGDPTKLVGWYKLDETTQNATIVDSGTSGPATNLAASGFYGVFGPQTTYKAPLSGNGASLRYAGNTAALAQTAPDGGDEYNLSQFSVSAWVNPAAIGTTQLIAMKGKSGTSNFNFYLQMQVSGGVVIGYSTAGVTKSSVVTAPLTAGAWSHVVGTYDGATLKVYINGVTDNTKWLATTTAPDSSVSGDVFSIGHMAPTIVQPWRGYLDDVRIYSAALTQADVTTLATATGSAGSPPTAPPFFTNMRLWMKGGAGTSCTTDGCTLTDWTDQSGLLGSLAANYTPQYVANALNGNPAVNFQSNWPVSDYAGRLAQRDWFTIPDTLGFGGTALYSIYSVDTGGGPILGPAVDASAVTGRCYLETGFEGRGLNVCTNTLPIAIGTTSTQPSLHTFTRGGGFFNIYWNGKYDINSAAANNTDNKVLDASTYYLGNRWSTFPSSYGGGGGAPGPYGYNGNIAEVLMYTGQHTAAEQNKVQSYLACKYGITLDQTSPQNYTTMDGTVMWDSAANTGYKNNITCIATDTATSLNQLSSKSINTTGIVTIAAATSQDAGDSVVFGDNNGSTAAWSTTNAPAGYRRIAREWKAQQTGVIGTVTLSAPAASFAAFSGNLYFVQDLNANGVLTDETPVLMTNNAGTWTVSGVNFLSGSRFTFVIDATPAPTAAPALTPASDSGVFNNDKNTNVTLPTFTGICVTGQTVRLYKGATLLGSGVCSGSNYSITITVPLSTGPNAIDATFDDGTSGESQHGPSTTVTYDNVAPTMVSVTPANGATGVAQSTNSFSITFNEAIGASTANVLLRTGGSTIQTIAASAATISGVTATMTPAAALSYSTTYALQIQSPAFIDIAGNAYAGFTNDTSWSFTTEAAPPPPSSSSSSAPASSSSSSSAPGLPMCQ